MHRRFQPARGPGAGAIAGRAAIPGGGAMSPAGRSKGEDAQQKSGTAVFLPWQQDIARTWLAGRSEEHTSELQSLMRISYAVFCLKKKQTRHQRVRIKTI